MKTVYLRHKISCGEIHNLSDKESGILLSDNSVEVEDPIIAVSPNGQFLAQVVYIAPASIEIEIIEQTSKVQNQMQRIVVMQSVLSTNRMTYNIEKSVELGIDEIIPLIPYYSEHSGQEAQKMLGRWQGVVAEARKQSLTTQEFEISKPMTLSNESLREYKSYTKICLVTENVNATSLSKLLKSKGLSKDNDIIIAVGPVKGWHASDIKIFKDNKFNFVRLGDIVLRSETASIVTAAAIKLFQGKI